MACGTGYWTRQVSATATSIIAVDLAPETLAIERAQTKPDAPIDYRIGDAFNLAVVGGAVDSGLVAFWWSHVTVETLRAFLTGLHRRLGKDAKVLVMDNRYVEGSNYPITRTDASGNTYQRRTLDNGAEYEVLKNFPSGAEVSRAIVDAGGIAPVIRELSFYWYATYVVGGAEDGAPSATRQ